MSDELNRCPSCSSPLTQVGNFRICGQHGQVSLQKPSGPMGIFLSYGHDANEELVRRIKADLEKRGHDVWFDESEIRFGDDWRRQIRLNVNGDAIYGTRSWRTYGERPTKVAAGSFHDTDTAHYTTEDFRFTTKGDVLYAIGLAWPTNGEAMIRSLAATAGSQSVRSVSLLGSDAKPKFEQRPDGLHVELPAQPGLVCVRTPYIVLILNLLLASIKGGSVRPGRSSFSYVAAALLILGNLLCLEGTPMAQESQPRSKVLAQTPPMGWNSWDSYGLRINEQQFRENVEAMAMKLKPFGYTYAVIDEGWYMVNPEDRPKPELLKYAVDEDGRFIPVTARFPSALQNSRNSGFQEIAHAVHAQGLKFGIHIIRGIPRESALRNLPIEGSAFKAQDAADQNDPCPWDPTSWGIKDNAAGQAWYDSLLRQYATWGVDFLKVDCIADHPYKASEIQQIELAIQHSGRDIVLSLSPGPTAIERHAEVADLAQMWRISNDIWDIWIGNSDFPIGIKNQFENAARWAEYTKPGNWPDADMLPVGELRPYPDVGPGPRHTRLTTAEQQTQLSLWAMTRSPLIIGANLTLLDPDTLRLLCNTDILKIDQTATASRQVLREGDLVIWTADLPANQHALAAFNLGENAITLHRPLSDFFPSGPYDLKNAWTGARLPVGTSLSTTIEPHASVVLMLDKK